MAANINIELFKRYAPKKKLEIINALTENGLLAITNKTILRIIKEAGRGDSNKTRCKYKTLFLSDAGNNWNSKVTNVYNWKKDEVYFRFTSRVTIQIPMLLINSETFSTTDMKSCVWDISKSHSEMVILTRNQPTTIEQTEPELSRLFLLPMLNASTNQN